MLKNQENSIVNYLTGM
jgi:predicted enzyme related to lactoylglutathione lyase